MLRNTHGGEGFACISQKGKMERYLLVVEVREMKGKVPVVLERTKLNMLRTKRARKIREIHTRCPAVVDMC